EKNHDRADDRDEHGIEVEPANAVAADGSEDEAADESADDAQHHVQDAAFAAAIDDAAGRKACDQAEQNPPEQRHHRKWSSKPARKCSLAGRAARPAGTGSSMLRFP